jgi:ABC-2 type transport system permease protein
MTGRLVRIELAKLRTIGLPWALLGGSSALTLLVALLKASRADKHSGRLAVGPLNSAHGLAGVLATPDYATLLALVLGVIVVTGEFRHHTITTTYLAFPKRVRVLVAKMLASASVGILFGLLASIISTAVGLGFVAANHYPVALGFWIIVRYGAGDVLACAFLAALGVAVGTLIRNQLVAIIAAFAWSLLAEGILYALSSSLAAYLPYSSARQLAGATLSGVNPLPFAAGAALIAALAVALAVVTTRTTLTRDVS